LPSPYRFELASPADDGRLCEVLAATPTPGAVAVRFRREPSYFAAARVEGPFHQTVVCRHEPSGEIVGCGGRSVAMRSVNGAARPIGYLGQLRLLAEHRRRGLVPRGYRFFRRLHADGRAACYLTTIGDDNRTALELLTSGRAGLPAYHGLGRYRTLVLGPRQLPQAARVDIEVRRATLDDRPALLEFLAREGPRRQFFPQVDADDLFTAEGTYRGLPPGDVWTAWRNGMLCGTLGVWDQRAFRRQQIAGYGGWIGRLRPAYNLLAPMLARPQLPAPGEIVPCRLAALPVTEGHDPELLLPLLARAVAEQLATGESLLLGVHEADPWYGVLRRYAPWEYVTRLFFVCFDDGEPIFEQLDGRPPYLELGCL